MTPTKFWWNQLNKELIQGFLRAYDLLCGKLDTTVHAQKFNIMDNKASKSIKRLLQKSKTVVQLAPPHIHRRSAAKRAIRTFKNNFVAGIASLGNNFPIYLWCPIVKQSEITINLLHISRTKPILLAYTQLFGAFDFNVTPMLTLCKKVIAHEKPNQHTTWRKHGVSGWYIGP